MAELREVMNTTDYAEMLLVSQKKTEEVAELFDTCDVMYEVSTLLRWLHIDQNSITSTAPIDSIVC